MIYLYHDLWIYEQNTYIYFCLSIIIINLLSYNNGLNLAPLATAFHPFTGVTNLFMGVAGCGLDDT